MNARESQDATKPGATDAMSDVAYDEVDPKKAQSARQLRDVIRRLVVSQGALDESRRPCGAPLSLPHAHALLGLLGATQPLTLNALAAGQRIDRTNVSRLCAKMEALGELERASNPQDGRALALRLTEHGERVARHVDATSAARFGAILDALGPRAPSVLSALDHLLDAIQRIEQE